MVPWSLPEQVTPPQVQEHNTKVQASAKILEPLALHCPKWPHRCNRSCQDESRQELAADYSIYLAHEFHANLLGDGLGQKGYAPTPGDLFALCRHGTSLVVALTMTQEQTLT
mmetsp:Transcript_11565/g.16501  ORF Transcript_11565/g.16501 Transcript_11565/m.16501 type:complete len:112 (+) Transcript_11565:69-404(+)